MSRRILRFKELAFEFGDAFVEESVVGACGGESFAELALLVGEFPDALFELGVLGDRALHRVRGVFGLQVADLAEQNGDALALCADLGVCDLQRVFGVERTLSP